ncbi:hypothetical protein RFI_18711, partial [Reticulomyxa filosa]
MKNGMETLATLFVADISELLELESKSLDSSYRMILSGAHRLHVLLQTLCHKYRVLEYEKKQQISQKNKKQQKKNHKKNSQSVDGTANRNTALSVGMITRHESFRQTIRQTVNTEMDEFEILGQFTTDSTIDDIFRFISTQVQTRLQYWMDKSLRRTGDAIVRAAEIEKWTSDVAKETETKDDPNAISTPHALHYHEEVETMKRKPNHSRDSIHNNSNEDISEDDNDK